MNTVPDRVGALWEFRHYKRRPDFDRLIAGIEQGIIQECGLKLEGDGKKRLRWRQLPPIVDAIAEMTASDVEFSDVLWTLFGRGEGHLEKYIDPRNLDLPKQYLNTGSTEEQFHHFLASATGDMGEESGRHPRLTRGERIPSHLLNELPLDWCIELQTARAKHQPLNRGDIALYLAAQAARDAFLRGGRKTVGDSIRNLLYNPDTRGPRLYA